MRNFLMPAAFAVAMVLAGCGEPAATPAAEPAAVVEAPPQPKRLPIGEITKDDVPALMAAVYTDGIPENVSDIGAFLLGERAGLLTGADDADACATCQGKLSLFYLVRTEEGFLMQADYRDFHASGSGGKFNREIKLERLGASGGGAPTYAGFTDVNVDPASACAAKTLTVVVFTEAGPRTALSAPFGHGKGGSGVKAQIIEAPQSDFTIEYVSAVDDWPAPYLFVNNSLRPSYPAPAWTQQSC